MQIQNTRDWLFLVVDKLAWGLILAVFAFWLNRGLERWRQATTASREWAKEEATRISEVLLEFGDLEAATDRCLAATGAVVEDLKGGPHGHPTDEHELERRDSCDQVSATEKEIRRKLYRYRYWLGKELEDKALSYLEKNDELIGEQGIVGSHDIDRMGELCGELEAIRVNFHEAVRRRYSHPHAPKHGKPKVQSGPRTG